MFRVVAVAVAVVVECSFQQFPREMNSDSFDWGVAISATLQLLRFISLSHASEEALSGRRDVFMDD